MRFVPIAAVLTFLLAAALPAQAAGQRNVVIFVADGLRYSSVTPETAPTMARIRREGVDFANSHAAYPTLTTANASVIATGHYLGDTGNYANTLYLEAPIQCRPGQSAKIIFIEDDCVLRKMKEQLGSGYLGQTTILQAARAAGYNTVLVGKRGPLAIQFLAALDSKNEDVNGPVGVFIDESTNHPANHDGSLTMSTMLGGQFATDVAKATGIDAPPETTAPNLTQQAYLLSATTQVIIPGLKKADKPFVMLYWSRDPDATQHNSRESSGTLNPGINSFDGRAAIRNADDNLRSILEALKKWGLAGNTDVFVIADHGFSTIARGIPARDGSVEQTLSSGFLAVDVAKWLGNQNLYDPDKANAPIDTAAGKRPAYGSALIGPSPDAPIAMVAANGATDFIYVPAGPDARATTKRIYDGLIEQPYVGALFVNDDFLKAGDPKDFAGSLPMSEINLVGSAGAPRPAIVIGFRTFAIKGCKLGEQMCAAEIVDTSAPVGQGMHGSFSRADTRNFMAAIGPSFKRRFVDRAPIGNVDVAPTVARILGIKLTGPGTLKGRVIGEALAGGKMPKVARRTVVSARAANGVVTVLRVQQVGTTRYFDAGGIPGRMVGLTAR
jgi:arylsulfatase A-like enzyme